jgi:hypothetical protein
MSSSSSSSTYTTYQTFATKQTLINDLINNVFIASSNLDAMSSSTVLDTRTQAVTQINKYTGNYPALPIRAGVSVQSGKVVITLEGDAFSGAGDPSRFWSSDD